MPRSTAVLLAMLVCLAAAPSASARSFVVSKNGANPSIAVDARGVTHIAWDTVGADRTSTTHYCQVPRKAKRCKAGTERTFAPVTGARDFVGPKVFLTGPGGVLVTTSRCCAYAAAPNGEEYSESTYAIASADNGATFAAPAWVGTLKPDADTAYGNGVLYFVGVGGGGTALQAAAVGGFEARENFVTPALPVYGGVGFSPKGSVVAVGDGDRNVLAGPVGADPNVAPIAFKRIGRGTDVVTAGGPRGVDVFYKDPRGNQRYVLRRVVGGKAGKVVKVSDSGFPIFGSAFQDAAGRAHAVWRGSRGLTYRRSAKNGRGFGKFKRVSRGSSQYNLVVAANRKGTATVAYDSNGPGRVGGYTVG